MPFDEALKRFIGTNPKEVEESIGGRAKKKKPPGNKAKPKIARRLTINPKPS